MFCSSDPIDHTCLQLVRTAPALTANQGPPRVQWRLFPDMPLTYAPLVAQIQTRALWAFS